MVGSGFRLGVDLGTSTTVAMLQSPGGQVLPLLFDGSPLLSSAVLLGPDGRLHTGRDAAHLARSAPQCLEPNPKRRIDEGAVLLGDTEVPVRDLLAAVLGRVAAEATRVVGGPPDLILTHPATWGASRRATLTAAARQAGFTRIDLVAEPFAAASFYARTHGAALADGDHILVYDLGAGTCDVTLLRRLPAGFEAVASDGLDDVGGLDVDAAVVRHLEAVHGNPTGTPAEGTAGAGASPGGRWQFWQEVRSAKEMLSRASSTVVHLPALGREVPLGREEFEELARPVLLDTVAMAARMLAAAGVGASPYLVGGSSRIPLVATLLHTALGTPPVVVENPELVVAQGALFPSLLTDRSGSVPEPPLSSRISPRLPAAGPPATANPLPPLPIAPLPISGLPISGLPVIGEPVIGEPVTGLPVSAAPVSYEPFAPLPVPPLGRPAVPAPRQPGGSASDLSRPGGSAFDLSGSGGSAFDPSGPGGSAFDLSRSGGSAFDPSGPGGSASDLSRSGGSAFDPSGPGGSASDPSRSGSPASDRSRPGGPASYPPGPGGSAAADPSRPRGLAADPSWSGGPAVADPPRSGTRMTPVLESEGRPRIWRRRRRRLVAAAAVLLLLTCGGVLYALRSGTGKPHSSMADGSVAGQYVFTKVPQNICPLIDTTPFGAFEPDPSYSVYTDKRADSTSANGYCSLELRARDPKQWLEVSLSLQVTLEVQADLADATLYFNGRREQYAKDDVVEVPGLGDAAFIYMLSGGSLDRPQFYSPMLRVRASNLLWTADFSADRRHGAPWSDAEKADLRAQLLTAAKLALDRAGKALHV